MIHEHLEEKRSKAGMLLNYIGIIVTISALAAVFIYSWHHFKEKEQFLLNQSIADIKNKADVFFYSIYSEMDKLPQPDNNGTCNKTLKSGLRAISFENTSISAAFITDKQGKLLCSSVKDFNQLPVKFYSNHTQINGPFFNKQINQSYFLLLRKKGNHIQGVYILGSILRELVDKHDKNLSGTIFYDYKKHQPMLIAEPNQSNTSLSAHQPSRLTLNHGQTAKSRLDAIDNMQLIILLNKFTLFKKIWLTEFLFISLTLLLLAILYYLTRRILEQRYSFKTVLQYALRSEQFFPLYQPVYNSDLKKYVGVEVLIRWKNSFGALIVPDQFIQEAENTGIIFPIMGYLIERSYKELKPILDKDPQFHVAFNLTQGQIKDKDFVEELMRLTGQYEIDPSQVVLELTERYLPDFSDEDTKKTIMFLQSKGYSLAIDDFGTGHASINYLRQFPFDFLKIDKLYIQSIGSGAVTEKLAKSIIDMAQSLNITMIAEGVETSEQFDYVTSHGINLLQGWYFSKALPSETLNEFLNRGEKHAKV